MAAEQIDPELLIDREALQKLLDRCVDWRREMQDVHGLLKEAARQRGGHIDHPADLETWLREWLRTHPELPLLTWREVLDTSRSTVGRTFQATAKLAENAGYRWFIWGGRVHPSDDKSGLGDGFALEQVRLSDDR